MQFFLGFSGYSSKVPFDQSMIAHFRKRFSDDDLRRFNELVVQRRKEMLIEAAVTQCNDADNPSGDNSSKEELLLLDSLVKSADWPEGKHWGTLSIDASCTPADINYPTDLRLLNEARQSTERRLMASARKATVWPHRRCYDRGKAAA